MSKHSLRRAVPLLAAALLLFSLFPPPARSAATQRRPHQAGSAYTNPVIPQNVPDPTVIKALDGYYYLIASSGYWTDGSYHLLPVFRSTDLVHWTFMHDAFSGPPSWVGSSAALVSPDLTYADHRYLLYYAASGGQTQDTATGSEIGVATASTPGGLWVDAGAPLLPPGNCSSSGSGPACAAPAALTGSDGQRFLSYGSWSGGTVVQKLTADGLHPDGAASPIGHAGRYGGSRLIARSMNGKTYYYDLSSAAGCCAGPNSAGSVEASRATSPLGPFVDQNGFPMLTPAGPPDANTGAQGGGFPTLRQNGNRWHGLGGAGLVTDLAGQDWMVYHGVDERHGWVDNLDPKLQVTLRQTLLDRLDWTADGWPVVNAGTGASDSGTAPVTRPLAGDNFNRRSGCAAPGTGKPLKRIWRLLSGRWSVRAGTCATGGFLEQKNLSGAALAVTGATVQPGYRAGCDLRLVRAGSHGWYGCAVSYTGPNRKHGTYVAAFIDPGAQMLRTVAYRHGLVVAEVQSQPLPGRFDPADWHHLTVDEDVSNPAFPLFRFRLSGPDGSALAVQERALPQDFGKTRGAIGTITLNAHAAFDNLSAARLSQPVTPAVQPPAAGPILPELSTESGNWSGQQWSWVREDPARHAIVSGRLSITGHGDLYRGSNDATNLLLESPPSGDFTVETRLAFDPSADFQQAGLLVYGDDDHYLKFVVAHHLSLTTAVSGKESLEPLPSRQTACDVTPSVTSNIAVTTYSRDRCPLEGESQDYLANGRPSANGSTARSPALADWLRIERHGDVYTPYLSLDGTHWVRGTAWDLSPVDRAHPIRIGLFALSAGPHDDVPALFEYLRVYGPPRTTPPTATSLPVEEPALSPTTSPAPTVTPSPTGAVATTPTATSTPTPVPISGIPVGEPTPRPIATP